MDVTYHDSDTEAFVMDALGNRTGNQTLRDDGTVNFTVDSLTNRYTSVGGSSISHDDAGNLTQDHDGYHYVYDYENRVVRIYKMDGQTEIDISYYRYDALGRRIAKYDSIAAEMTLYYHNDNWQVLAEYDGSNNLQRYFIYGNYIDEPLIMNDGTDDYYYARDHLYSTVALIDDAGSVVERYEYNAYGYAHITDGAYIPRTASAYANPYTFTGRQLDALCGGSLRLFDYRHRSYGPLLARFMQHDSHGMIPAELDFDFIPESQFVNGLNIYWYALGNPLFYIDPYGYKSFGFGAGKLCTEKKCNADKVNEDVPSIVGG